MWRTVQRVTSCRRHREASTSIANPPSQDPTFFELINLNPRDDEDREKFDNAAVLQYVKDHPDSVRVKYSFKSGNRGSIERYPLNRLVALGGSLELIRCIHKACPEALESTSNPFNSTALHSACSFQASIHVVRYLAKKAPEAARTTNKHAFLPLHLACQRNASLEVVRLVYRLYPEALLRKNKLGKTPLMEAQENDASSEVIAFLSAKLENKRTHQESSSNAQISTEFFSVDDSFDHAKHLSTS